MLRAAQNVVPVCICLGREHLEQQVAHLNLVHSLTSLSEAGFVPEAKYSIAISEGNAHHPVQRTIRIDNGELRMVAPGDHTRYGMVFAALPSMLHVDDPLRAYVRDSNRKVWWGGSAPIFGRMVDSGWKPPSDTDPRLLERVPEPVVPKPSSITYASSSSTFARAFESQSVRLHAYSRCTVPFVLVVEFGAMRLPHAAHWLAGCWTCGRGTYWTDPLYTDDAALGA
jgi:hypothetical protein